MAPWGERTVTALVVRAGSIAALALWSNQAAAQALARQGLYEWIVGVGWATIVSSIVLALTAGIASSARRMANPATPVESRLMQVVADLLSALVGGLLAVPLGELAGASPPYVAVLALVAGWGGATYLDGRVKQILGRGSDGS